MRARVEVPNLYLNPASVLKCDQCHAHLGLWRMVRRALFKKKGDVYIVRCKTCGCGNRRIKGSIGAEIDEKWNDDEEHYEI